MKVFRKELYYKATGKTEESVKANKITWPMECDGKEAVKSAFEYDILGTPYGAEEAWIEEVCDIEREADREQMKDWKIGTEHVVRINGKDKRIVVESSCKDRDFTCRTHCALYQFTKDIMCCDANKCASYARPDTEGVYYKEIPAPSTSSDCIVRQQEEGRLARFGKVQTKPLVLKLFFSPERNMTFTEHDINPDVGFVTGKYYRFIGKESSMRLTLWDTMRKILEHKVLKCTNGTGRSANFEGIGDINNEIMYTWISKGSEKEEFKYWKEMRPFVTTEAPDIITFDELVSKIKCSGSVTGLFVARESKEKQKMKVDENFTFKKKYVFGTTLHEPKVVKAHKAYANDGACEACGATINKGDFVLTANETDCNKVTKKTHRLCASCTAEYIKAKSGTDEKQSYIEGFKAFVKENDIKVGTRIRITKDFGKDEDAGTYGHKGAEGKRGTVYYVGNKYINVRMDGEKGWWSVPYYAMEVIKEELKYKPITGFESGKWYVCHAKERLSGWSSQGKMDALLDGKPHKCIFGKGLYADFEDLPLHGEFLGERGWRFRNQLQFFEEVPAPVVSYAERQAQWVKENNVRVGTKVRVTRGFVRNEDGSTIGDGTDGEFGLKKDLIGQTVTVTEIHATRITVEGGWYVPYGALEKVQEPWFKLGDKVRITIKSSEAYNKIGTVTNVSMHKGDAQTVYMKFAEFWDTKVFNADSKEKIGELYVPTYKELQDAWIAKHNLKEGDKVVILRTAKDRENGWPNNWCDTMNNKVGQMYTFDGAGDNGIGLSCGYSWPYFVLGVVKE